MQTFATNLCHHTRFFSTNDLLKETFRICLASKYLNIIVFKYHGIWMSWYNHGIFYINPTNICLKIKYSKSWYLVDMQEASHCYKNFRLKWNFKYSKNTMLSSRQWYLKQSSLHASQIPPWKNIMVFFNTMILLQNFKNTLFQNTPLLT
jgi:hypothetical protein